ncbi:hypothetical protein M413DRAFT_31455 [Hebeloma cylindrosporum]|uniref:Uncharacterized protein n=1 Tax=Hebeloma cylindrosporum TaxID=76867 RepID=A0A0C2XG06_HEBCY|nr:hypothetical protein M413DRAFT_31455 [Hebeloma cylindrosporum h7]
MQILIVSFRASEWKIYQDIPSPLDAELTNSRNPARNRKERKTAFLRNLINVFKVADRVIPGSANRSAFEEFLNPLFKSMEELETAWTKVPEFSKVYLSFISPGEHLADSEDVEDASKLGIRASSGPSAAQNVVLGTAALGVRCLFKNHITGQGESTPRTLLPAKVICESNLQRIFGGQEEQKPTTMSGLSPTQRKDGRDEYRQGVWTDLLENIYLLE